MSAITIRKAREDALVEIVRLFSEDPYAHGRESYRVPLPACYTKAFAAIDRDPNQLLLVAEKEEKVVGTLQLTIIPNISFSGGLRALIEAVMVDSRYQGQGIGSQMIAWAITRAREKGCRFV